jgi:hypothetical protein
MDTYTETKRVGFFSRIGNSIRGIFIGILLFLGSFVILFINEGTTNIAKIARQSIDITNNEIISSETEGKLIALSGIITSDETLGDTYLESGKYLNLERKMEAFLWKEDQDTQTTKNVGGSETQTTTYVYTKNWVQNNIDSNRFNKEAEYQNPQVYLEQKKYTVRQASIDTYQLNAEEITFPKEQPLSLSLENSILHDGFMYVNPGFLFKGTGSISNPNIGDMRISYAGNQSPLSNVTVFGAFNSSQKTIDVFYNNDDDRLYRALIGDRKTGIATMQKEHSQRLWVFRGLGFMLMWIGLIMLLEPISVLLDIIPIAGRITRSVVGFAAFIIALSLSAVTIIASMILHNIYAIIISIIIVSAIAILIVKRRTKKSQSNN